MEKTLETSILRVCRALAENEVDYIFVGGTAVALNGYYRISTDQMGVVSAKPDLDVWYRPDYTNYFNLLSALDSLGHDVDELRSESNPDPYRSFFRIDLEQFTLDLLPTLKSGLVFSEVRRRAETVVVQNVPIHFMEYNDLILDKRKTGRKKDLDDIDHLI
jgi:predicted nucleotidyltransferase